MFNLLFCFRGPFRKLEAYATIKSTALPDLRLIRRRLEQFVIPQETP
jgi:hypothetical protein